MGRRRSYFAGGSRFLRGSAASSWPLRLLKNIRAINPHPIKSEKKVPRPSAIQPCLLISMVLVTFQTEMAQITAAIHIKTRTAIRTSWPKFMRFIIFFLSFTPLTLTALCYPEQREHLLAITANDAEHPPVLKFSAMEFDSPCNKDGDPLFGLADLGEP